MSGGATPAGWYDDPTPGSDPGTKRWWDGTGWTEQTQAAPPPPPGPSTLPPPQPASSAGSGPHHEANQGASWPSPPSTGQSPQGSLETIPLPELAARLKSHPVLAIAAAGLALCLLSLILPWTSVELFGESLGSVRASGGATVGVLVGTALGGFGIYRVLLGARNGVFAAGGGAALNLIVALVNIADVQSVSDDAFGSLSVGIGLVTLLLGALIGGGGSLAHLILNNKSR